MVTEISTVAGLQAMNDDLTEDYALVDDIDAAETETWNGGDGFEPIADWDNSETFTGTLDGQGHTITDLYIDRASDTEIGLFEALDVGSVITDLSIDGWDVTGRTSTALLAGADVGGGSEPFCKFENVHVTNSTITDGGEGVVGGFVGAGGWTEITDCTIKSTHFSISDGGAGGFAGECWGPLTRLQAEISMDLTGGGYDVGGITGYYTWDQHAVMQEVTADVQIQGGADVGGLVGNADNDTEIRNSYATGTIDCGSDMCGGIAAIGDTALENVYSAVELISTNSETGGVIGSTGSNISATDVYWDTEVSGYDRSTGQSHDEIATGLSTSEMTGDDAATNMQFTYDGEPWTITDSYPVLFADGGSVGSFHAGSGVAIGVASETPGAGISIGPPGFGG